MGCVESLNFRNKPRGGSIRDIPDLKTGELPRLLVSKEIIPSVKIFLDYLNSAAFRSLISRNMFDDPGLLWI
jgi:hypothetical protein